MSQVGTIVSVASESWCQQVITNWDVQYAYKTDAGAEARAAVTIGSGSGATVALWSSPAGSITVTPNPPGTTNPVTLPCPGLIQWAAFGVPVKGFPIA